MSEEAYAGYYADVISFSAIAELFPTEASLFRARIGLRQTAESLGDDVLTDFWEWRGSQDREKLQRGPWTDPKWGSVQEAFRRLQLAFAEEYDAVLVLGFHDPGRGSYLYDFYGPFFALENIYEIKANAKGLEKYVERKTWVSYG